MGRKLLWASLALTPVVLLVRYGFGVEGTAVFALAALALMPLAFVIGEATEQVSEHTGGGIGAFLNASFGNAPELIIALFAVGSGLPNVVRGSIIGSVVSTLLLVLGAAMLAGADAPVDRRSLVLQAATIVFSVLLFLVPSVGGWHGDPERHSLYVLTLPVAGVLLVVYLLVTVHNLRIHNAAHREEPNPDAWSLRTGIAVLALATVATAFVSEILVHSLDAFGHALGLSQFFVAIVIVAFVGNAAEHGGAIVVALRGRPGLGAEIAISSAVQVAVFVAPAIAILSFLVGNDLPLSFRPIEVVSTGIAALLAIAVVADGRSQRWRGAVLVAAYAILAVAFFYSGDR